MNLLEYSTRMIPETHNRYMYLDGYTPEQVLTATRYYILNQKDEREESSPRIIITSEVKLREG